MSPKLEDILADKITNIDEFTPADLTKLADVKDSILVEYNVGWNGTSWFLFAPIDSEK